MTYKDKIDLILINTGLTQKQLAERLGTSEKQLSFWRRGLASARKNELQDKIDAIYCREVLKQISFI